MASRWEPFAEVGFRPVDDGDRRPSFTPAVDIFEDEDAVLVRVELPGVRADDVEVDAGARVLTVRGERRLENEAQRDGYHRLERPYGVFSRSFELPASVDGQNAAAVMTDGVLTVRIPKRAAAGVRRAS
jgi:HSP20 family protein